MSLYSSLSLTGAQLLTGIVGAFTIAVGAIPLMVPIDQSKREILIYTMQGPVWALFSTHLIFQATASHCLRSLFGTWFASAVGCLYYLIVQAMCGGTIENYQREAAIAFAIPFTFVIALCHRSSACKLRKVIGFEAAASSFFTPVALFLGKPYEEALWNSIFESYGIIVSLVTIALLNLFGLLPQAGTSPLRDFDLATSDFFDVLCMSMMSGNRHASTLDAAQSRFEKALNRASASSRSARVRSRLWRMASFLYSLRKSVAEGVYPELIFDKLWKPTAADLLELRSEIRAALLSEDGHDTREAIGVREEAASFKASLRGASVTARQAMREHNGIISTEEMARFNFAEEAVLHFAYIIADYTAARNEEMAPGKLDKGCRQFKVVRWCNDLTEFCVNWWQEPFFESNGMTLWEKLIYPAKITLTGTLTSIVLLLWGRVYPYMMSHVFWGFIAALFCMLPNTGATFNKVLRRIGGTLCALVAAVVCIFANPFNKAAFFVELLIVAFFGKVGSTFHVVGYGGPVFVLTWIIVAFQPSVSVPQPEEDTLWGVGWRMALTLVGVGMTSVLSCVVFPVFASVQLDTVSEETLKEQAKRVTDAVRQLIRLSDGDSKSSIVDEREELGELLSRTSNTRAALKEDAFAEVVVFGQWVMSGKEKRILQAQKSLDSLAKSTVCAYGACITCTFEIGQPATTELLAATSPHLEALATALERSIAQLEICLEGGEDGEAIMLDDEVHLQMMRCKDSFNERREMLVSKFKEGSDRFNEVVDSGGSILYHALYALYLFTEEWNALEIFLAGRKHAVSYPLEPAAQLDSISRVTFYHSVFSVVLNIQSGLVVMSPIFYVFSLNMSCFLRMMMLQVGVGSSESFAGPHGYGFYLFSILRAFVVISPMSSDLDLWKGLAIAINVIVCFIGIILSRWISRTKMYEISCALVAGVLLATGLVHLLSDSAESLADLTESMNGYPFPYTLCGIMFIVLLIIEQSVDAYQVKRKDQSPKLVKNDTNINSDIEGPSSSQLSSTSSQLTSADDDAKDMHSHDVNMSEASAIFIFLALSVHSIFEGLSLGASDNASQIASTLIAIAVHKGLAAYALGASFMEAKVSKWRMIVFSVIFAFMTPAGIAIGWGLESAESDTEVLSGVCSALAAGTFLYVGALEFVPMSFKPGSSYIIWKFIAVLVGYGAMSALAIWT